MVPLPAHSQTQKSSKKTGRIVVFCLLWGGIGLLLLAVLSAKDLVQISIYGHETSGQVIDQEIVKEKITTRANGKDIRVDVDRYDAIVSFTIEEGTFTISSYDGGRNAPLYPTGSQVTVVYRPEHPEKARIQKEISGFRGIFEPLMLVVFGAALIGTSKLVKFILKKM